MNVILRSKLFPLFWTGATAVTIRDMIYVRRDYWSWLPVDSQRALITHELVHVRQEGQEGAVRFFFKYIFQRSFRFKMELEAYTAEAQFWINQGVPKQYAVLIMARTLSSSLYRVSSYGGALLHLWENTK